MLNDILAAFAFLTIPPVGRSARGRSSRLTAWFPLVGLRIGALLVSVANQSPLDRDLSAFLILAIWVIVTGGLHLDGFGDCCDGLLASAKPEDRIRIMRDPRAGVWAVAGMVLPLLGK